MTEYQVYLAGAINNASDDGRGWRDDLGEGRVWFNDDGKNEMLFQNPLDEHEPDDVADMDPHDLVASDLRQIQNSDALLVRWNTEIPMAGTPMEMCYAHYQLALPIVTWIPQLQPSEYTEFFGSKVSIEGLSPWVRYHSDEIVSNEQSAIGKLIDVLEEQ